MKIKARCPKCEMWQLFKDKEIEPGTKSDVRCKMDWCRHVFDSSKAQPKKGPHPDQEVLKTS